MPRLFVGWPVPLSVKEEISEAIRPLRTSLPSASWVRPETYHITFSFLGEQSEQSVATIAGALDEALAGVLAEKVRIVSPGFFPNTKRPRVGWLEVAPAERLSEVAGRVAESLAKVRVERDQKAFLPHLTVVRTREKWSRQDVERFIEQLRPFRSAVCEFDRAILFGSVLTPRGAIHSVLHRVDLTTGND